MIRPASFSLCAVMLLASCDSATAPMETVHRFALVEVADRPVEFPVLAPPDLVIVADTIELRPDGTATHIVWRQVAGEAGPERLTWPLVWRHRLGRLEINNDCGPAHTCLALPHIFGRFTGDSFEVQGGSRFPDGARYYWLTAP